MNKFGKILAAVAVVIVLLVVGLFVLAKVLITPERIKTTVLPIAEETLQRKIELGEIQVSLFSGIELQNLKIYESDRQEVFVSTDLVRLKYQLLPLLAMKVVIDEVTVETPQIRVVRLKDGRFSFDDLVAGKQEPADKQPATGTSAASPVSLLVSKVRVSDGSLVFLDHQINDKAPFRTEISALQAEARGITLTGSIPVSLACKINEGKLAVDGDISLPGLTGNFKVKLDNVDTMAYSPYFKDAIPGALNGLTLSLETTVAGGADNVSAKGTLQGQGLNLTLDALPEAPLKDARVTVVYDVAMLFGDDTLEVRSAHVSYNDLAADVMGRIRALSTQPVLDLQVSVPQLDLQQALKSVPPKLVEGVVELEPSGAVEASAQLAGTLDDPVKLVRSASVTLRDVELSAAGQRPALNGRLNLADGQLVSEGLEMRAAENLARISMTASNLFGKPIMVRTDVSSEEFQLEPLLGASGAAAAATSTPPATSAPAASPKGEELGPFDLPVQAEGTIRVGKALYKGLAISDFNVNYQLKNNILTVSRMTGGVAGGTFANTARVDLGTRGLAYSAEIGVKAVQADPLLTAFAPKAAGTMLGAMTLQMDVAGKGTQWETLSKKLTGKGDVLLADGRVVSPGLVKGFATFLQLPDLNEIRFENFQGNVRIADGQLLVDSQITSDDFRLSPKGAIGLDGSLNLSMDTRLSPRVSERLDSRGKVTRYLTDKDGWSQLPLLISGNYLSPKFGLDPKGVQEQASKALGKELERQIDRLLGGGQKAPDGQPQAPADDTTQPEDPSKKLLQDSLKKLFGN